LKILWTLQAKQIMRTLTTNIVPTEEQKLCSN